MQGRRTGAVGPNGEREQAARARLPFGVMAASKSGTSSVALAMRGATAQRGSALAQHLVSLRFRRELRPARPLPCDSEETSFMASALPSFQVGYHTTLADDDRHDLLHFVPPSLSLHIHFCSC